MNTSKRAKTVTVKFEKVKIIRIIPEYKCPTCKTTFRGNVGASKNTLRFRCECGQELIVKELKK